MSRLEYDLEKANNNSIDLKLKFNQTINELERIKSTNRFIFKILFIVKIQIFL